MLDLTPPALHGHAWIGMTLKPDGLAFSAETPALLDAQARRVFPATWDSLTIGEQVHGIHLAHITHAPPQSFTRVPATDGLSTPLRGAALGILTADCTAVTIVDPETPALGVGHAGWRGTYDPILPPLLKGMVERHGTRPASCFAVLGPAIGGSCYEIDLALADMFRAQFPHSRDFFSIGSSGKPRLDLRGLQRRQLLDLGLPADRITISPECTHCHPGRYHSYRRDGASAGRHLTLAVLL